MRISDWSSDVCSSDLVEFRCMASRRRVDADFALLALEEEGEPALRLAAILPFQADPDEMGRQVIIDPAAGFPQEGNRSHAGLFIEFAIGGCQCVLALVDPALRHLPEQGRAVILAVRSEEHTSELQSLMRISYAVF